MNNETVSGTMLPRVADLERSVQWTSLANDIHELERRRVDDGRPVIERHTYQRGSMPEMQRACTVRFDDDPAGAIAQRGPDSYPESETSRWSWKPKTEFERDYFYKDYKDYYCGRLLEPAVVYEGDRSYSREEARRGFSSSPRRRRRHPVGLEKEHFSDSRERLHEIFEHNRYLRRQFFADTSRNARRDCDGLHSRSLGRNQNRREASTGFGSTETLTSQSNQSSMSSINDRKSRTQTTRTPEEEEEEDALVEFARRNNVIRRRRFNSPRVTRRESDGKVLVNILPGSEVRRVGVRDAPAVNLGEASNERNEQRMLDDRKRNLPEYIFGGDPKVVGSRRERNWNRLSHHETTTCPWTISERASARRIPRDLWKSLPDLTIQKQRKLDDAPLHVARAVNVPEERATSHIARSGHGSGHGREQRSARPRSIGRGQSISEAMTVSPRRLTPPLRRVPPPLDLSTVNEQCERMEADEKRRLNDYSVDVTILRSRDEDRVIKDHLTVAGNERWAPVNGAVFGAGIGHEGRSSCNLHRSCGDLRSPQLVNDCKSLTSNPVRMHRRPIDKPDASRRASPLFDQTSPIGGPRSSTGNTLPSTVYGPIPYSQ